MPSIEAIYQESVKPLPLSDKIRLAEIIMEHVNQESPSSNGALSALDLLEAETHEKLFKDSEDVDQHLKSERESWEN